MARSSDSVFPLSLLRDRTFQAREIRRVAKLSLVYLAVTTVLVGLFYQQMLGNLIDGMAPLLFVSEDMALAAEAVPSLGEVLGDWLLAMLAINVVITVALGVWITRRLGQPLLAIKRTLREIGTGNLDVRMRTTDERDFGEIATELAAAMSSVRDQVAAAKQAAAGAPDDAPGATPGAADVTADATTALPDATALQRAMRDTRAALDWFQVDGANDPHAGGDDADRVSRAD